MPRPDQTAVTSGDPVENEAVIGSSSRDGKSKTNKTKSSSKSKSKSSTSKSKSSSSGRKKEGEAKTIATTAIASESKGKVKRKESIKKRSNEKDPQHHHQQQQQQAVDQRTTINPGPDETKPEILTTESLIRDGNKLAQKRFEDNRRKLEYSDHQIRDRKPLPFDLSLIDFSGFPAVAHSPSLRERKSKSTSNLTADLQSSSHHRSEQLRKRKEERSKGSSRTPESSKDATPAKSSRPPQPRSTRGILDRRHSMKSGEEPRNRTGQRQKDPANRRSRRRATMEHITSTIPENHPPPSPNRRNSIKAKRMQNGVSMAAAASSTTLGIRRTAPQRTASGIRRLERQYGNEGKSLSSKNSSDHDATFRTNLQKSGSLRW